MKKIGIVSFHTAINYGVYLQAYALQEKVKNLGYCAEIIDYRKRTEKKDFIIKRILKNVFINKILISEYLKQKKQAKIINSDSNIKKRKKEFYRFALENFNLTKEYKTYNDICLNNLDYDACICGSDQIWNPLYTKCNPVYFLEFVKKNKRIAYAPSIGVTDIPSRYKERMEQKISDFECLSVREKSAAYYLEKEIKRKVYNVVDPTLLYTKDFWGKMAVSANQAEPYILCYFLGHSEKYVKIIEKVKKELNLNVIILPFSYEAIYNYSYEKKYASIEEFLGYYKDAEFVITDSFHGTAFSVNFRKDFYVIKREDEACKMHSRIFDFLSNIGLENRILEGNEIEKLDIKKINYSNAENILTKWVNDSQAFLENSLNSILNNS